MVFGAFPIEPTTLLAYVIAVSALIVSPGPATMIVLRYALASGRAVGLAAVAGVQIGLVGHTVLAVLGISLVIASSPVLFKSVAVAGAAYLGWLGIQGLRAGGVPDLGGGATVGHAKACRDAVLCNLLNPKVILLFLALLPNFVNPEAGDVIAQLIALSALLIALNILWQAPMALAADGVRRWLGRPETMHAVNRVSGVILLGMAALMLGQHLL